jgi:hypothetical protein
MGMGQAVGLDLIYEDSRIDSTTTITHQLSLFRRATIL